MNRESMPCKGAKNMAEMVVAFRTQLFLQGGERAKYIVSFFSAAPPVASLKV